MSDREPAAKKIGRIRRMERDLIDSVWSLMAYGEFYSPEDLANSSQQSTEVVTRVLEFLTHYGFTESSGKHNPLFRRTTHIPDPASSLAFLQAVVDLDL